MSADSLLPVALAAAVPLWAHQLKQKPWAEIQARLPELSNIISEKGDIILYRSNKKGETAKAFNALAEAIAALSFAPGGVRAFGQHWENQHSEFAPKERPCEEQSSNPLATIIIEDSTSSLTGLDVLTSQTEKALNS
jgi:uncharacterized protein YqjF (DUF2071 family)